MVRFRSSYAAWAQGWYADLVDDHRIAADRLTMTFVTTRSDSFRLAGAAAWSDPGAWDGGGTIGGHDYSGGPGAHDGSGGFDGAVGDGRRWRRRRLTSDRIFG